MQCYICKGKTERFVDEQTSLVYYYCDKCQFIFKSPQYYQPIEKQKNRYDLHNNDAEDLGYRAYFQRFVDFIIPYVGTPKTALDYGCGKTTLLADILKNIGIETDAFDPIYHPKNWNYGKQYDLIVSTEVFEHLHQPETVFRTLVEHLDRGGYLAIQTQFHPNDKELFKEWYYHHDPTHIVFYRPQTFRVLAQQYGCEYVADNGKNMVVLKINKK